MYSLNEDQLEFVCGALGAASSYPTAAQRAAADQTEQDIVDFFSGLLAGFDAAF